MVSTLTLILFLEDAEQSIISKNTFLAFHYLGLLDLKLGKVGNKMDLYQAFLIIALCKAHYFSKFYLLL